jgi:hypothetical protein
MARNDWRYGGWLPRGYDRSWRPGSGGFDRAAAPGEWDRYGPRRSFAGYDSGVRHGPASGDFRGYTEPMWPDDDEIRHAVRRTLFEDRWLDASAIEVRVEDAVVTLTGEVNDYLEARYAWDDAWETEGVEGVISRLEVRSAEGEGGTA